jgi:hypothetical protein
LMFDVRTSQVNRDGLVRLTDQKKNPKTKTCFIRCRAPA